MADIPGSYVHAEYRTRKIVVNVDLRLELQLDKLSYLTLFLLRTSGTC